MADNAEQDERVTALKAEAIALTQQLSAMPDLVARRREVVRELVVAIGAVKTAQTLGISRQAIYKLVKD